MIMLKLFEEFNKDPEVKIEYYDNGQKETEEWVLDGVYHKEDGPAFQYWYKNGRSAFNQWLLKGILHRENGPAIQQWNVDGKKYKESWYLNGVKYSRHEWIKKLKDIRSEHYEEQKMLYDVEKYNL